MRRRLDGRIARWGRGRWGLAPVALACAAIALGAGAPLASGAFTQPFLHQITRTEAGMNDGLACSPQAMEPGCPFSEAVAIDPEGNLWDVDHEGAGELPSAVSEFKAPTGQLAAGEFVKTLPLALHQPESLAIDYASDLLFISSHDGGEVGVPVVKTFDVSGATHPWSENTFGVGAPVEASIDNSCLLHEPALGEPSCKEFDPANGLIYVSHGELDPGAPFGDGLPAGVERFDAAGGCVPFSASAEYVSGCELVGAPGVGFSHESPQGMTVDAGGHIYVFGITKDAHGHELPEQVYEYEPSGQFLRAFSGEGTPGLNGNHGNGGWGGDAGPSQSLGAVAVDPVSGLLAVSVGYKKAGAVDEFDAAGDFIGQITEDESEPSVGVRIREPLSEVTAMTFDSHGDLYLVSNGTIDVFGPGRFLPRVKLGEVTQRTSSSATLNALVSADAAVNPEHSGLSECRFEYVSKSAFEHEGFTDLSSGGSVPCVPAAGEVPADSSLHAVHGEVEGLAAGVEYRYRLTAATAGVLGGSAHSEVLAFVAPGAPRVEAESVGNVSSAFVDLGARIAPTGADTQYIFEYVSAERYEPAALDPYAAGATAPAGGYMDIGSGGTSGDLVDSVGQGIGGLAAATTYHFRVVARNALGVSDGPDATFTTLARPVPGLPDGRAYELVTPADKGGGADMFGLTATLGQFFNADVGYASESGEALLLETLSAFGPAPASLHNSYVFRRDQAAGEWRMTTLAAPGLGVQSIASDVLLEPWNLSSVAFMDAVGSVASTGGARETVLAGAPGGPYAELYADVAKHSLEPDAEQTQLVGASRDLGHVLVESKSLSLCGGAEGQDNEAFSLCEWTGGGECALAAGNCRLVSVGAPCGAVLGLGRGQHGIRHGAVSSDGSRIVFTAPDPENTSGQPECWKRSTTPQTNPPQLYMRIGGSSTLELSAPEAGVSDPQGARPAVFAGASSDGSKVFFVTRTELTADALAADGAGHDPELYECEVVQSEGAPACSLTRISGGESGEADSDVQTVPAISADGSTVYFTARGQLTEDAPAPSGKDTDLYRYDTVSRRTVFVATVSPRDYPDNSLDGWSAVEGVAQEVALAPEASWYTTPDGRYLLFDSERDLTGYDTREAQSGDCPGVDKQATAATGFCDELYRYDAVAGSLICVSCDPNGERPVSNAFFAHAANREAADAAPPRGISNDGSYVFFDTADALVTADGNGTLDVYEWHDGTVSLISSGQDSSPSYFLGAGPDGRDVFIGTHARLTAQDTDSNGDVYDARIDGGFALTGEGPEQCEGDACQTPPPPPLQATPVSLSFSGPGNLASEPASSTKAKAKAKKKKKTKRHKHKPRGKAGRRRGGRSSRAHRTAAKGRS